MATTRAQRGASLWLRTRLGDDGSRAWPWLLWCASGLLAVIVVPGQLRGRPFWETPPDQLPQHLVMGLSYLGYVIYLRAASAPRRGVQLWTAVAAALPFFGVGYVALRLLPEVPYSRVVLALSAVIGLAAALMPYLRSSLRIAAAAGAAVAMPALLAAAPDPPTPPTERVASTALHRVTVTYHQGLVDTPAVDGGALMALDDGFLLATGGGEFHHVSWADGDTSLRATQLALASPANRDVFLADHAGDTRPPRLRVTDITIDSTARRLLAAHQYWNHTGRCFTMRVSAVPLDEALRGAPQWTPLFETRPCIRQTASFDDVETGGRLAWAPDGGLLLTVADHGFDGHRGPGLAQAPHTDYGKVLRLDLAGGRRIVTVGHRNPQGLAVARDGRVWATEHGPQGGDEINLIVEGRNYGWPLVTYGTDYGSERWIIDTAGRDHGPFAEPAYAFVPSVGLSPLIEITGDQFPAWDGDLLAGSLKRQLLYRIRTRGGVVTYVEPIRIDRRIRDIAEGSDGRLLLWTDEGDIVSLARAAALPIGEAVYRRCAGCHEPSASRAPTGPLLDGVVGRPVATVSGYEYSAALRRVGGHWTAVRLEAFLEDPQEFAPGNHMVFKGLTDSMERRAVVEYLTTRR